MKINFYTNSWIIFSLTLFSSCTIRQGDIIKTKFGTYQMDRKKFSSLKQSVIYGTIYDYDTREPTNFPAIQLNDKKVYRGSINGVFKFSVEPGKYRFTGKALPYEFVETKAITVNKGDSIKINFYLKPYTKPIID
jgi:hypothetical protein